MDGAGAAPENSDLSKLQLGNSQSKGGEIGPAGETAMSNLSVPPDMRRPILEGINWRGDRQRKREGQIALGTGNTAWPYGCVNWDLGGNRTCFRKLVTAGRRNGRFLQNVMKHKTNLRRGRGGQHCSACRRRGNTLKIKKSAGRNITRGVKHASSLGAGKEDKFGKNGEAGGGILILQGGAKKPTVKRKKKK